MPSHPAWLTVRSKLKRRENGQRNAGGKRNQLPGARIVRQLQDLCSGRRQQAFHVREWNMTGTREDVYSRLRYIMSRSSCPSCLLDQPAVLNYYGIPLSTNKQLVPGDRDHSDRLSHVVARRQGDQAIHHGKRQFSGIFRKRQNRPMRATKTSASSPTSECKFGSTGDSICVSAWAIITSRMHSSFPSRSGPRCDVLHFQESASTSESD